MSGPRMEDAVTDLVLACLHHLLAFGLAAILAVEFASVRPRLGASAIRRLAIVDAHYPRRRLLTRDGEGDSLC
jgi:uncharacterized membrane protein